MKHILSKGKAFGISSAVLFLFVNLSLRAQMSCTQPYEIWNYLTCPIVVSCEVVDNGYPPGYNVTCTYSVLVPAGVCSGPPAVAQLPAGCCDHDIFVVVVKLDGTLATAPPTVNGTANPTIVPNGTGQLSVNQVGACTGCTTSGVYNISWTPTHTIIN